MASDIHVHRIAPRPDGKLFGKTRYRNRCVTADCPGASEPDPNRRSETDSHVRTDVRTDGEGRDGRISGSLAERAGACLEDPTIAPPRPIRTGRPCLICKTPTAAGTLDPNDAVHPCCAEPELMRLSRDAVRRRRAS